MIDEEVITWVVRQITAMGLEVQTVNRETGIITLSVDSPVTRRYSTTGQG